MCLLTDKALTIREDIVKLVHDAKCGHIGGDLSVTDILVALYYKHMNCTPERANSPDRDRFVRSK